MSVRFREVAPTKKDMKGIDPVLRIEYQARSPMDLVVEVSLLSNPQLKHLSVLPEPKIERIDPMSLRFRCPISEKTRVRDMMRPPVKELRTSARDHLRQLEGYFINGVRLDRPFHANHP